MSGQASAEEMRTALVSIEKLRDGPAPVIEVTENTFRFLLPMYAPDGGEIKYKTIFIEPLLVVASSLLWIFVLPLAAVIRSGLTILDRLEASKPRGISFVFFG